MYKPILESRNLQVECVDPYDSRLLSIILKSKPDAFIWRAKHNPKSRNLAKKLFYITEKELSIPSFPSYSSYFYYDDKIVQHYLFQSCNIPTPETIIFYKEEEALEFIESCEYPLIWKSSHGAGSSNVGLLESKGKSEKYIRKIFSKGVQTFFKSEVQRDYVYFQKFVKDIKGDYRIVCYNDGRITGFFRKNREGEIFASGAGNNIPVDIPANLLNFAADIHQKLGNEPVMSYDVLQDTNGNWLVTEMSVLFGDLNSIIYSDSKVYAKDNSNRFELLDGQRYNRHEYFISLLLKHWGWNG